MHPSGSGPGLSDLLGHATWLRAPRGSRQLRSKPDGGAVHLAEVPVAIGLRPEGAPLGSTPLAESLARALASRHEIARTPAAPWQSAV
jgi:hypothetical protein